MTTNNEPRDTGDQEATEDRKPRIPWPVERDAPKHLLDQAWGTRRLLEQLDIGRKLLMAAQPSIRVLDLLTPQAFAIPELYATRIAVEWIGGHSAILAAREALVAQTRINETVQAWVQTQGESLERIREMLGSAESVAQLADVISRTGVPIREIELAHSATLKAWRQLSEVASFSATDALPRLEVGTWVAREASLSVSRIIPEIEEPSPRSERGPQELGNRMLVRLKGLDADLPLKLEGAWERIETPGPDAVGQAASSLVELIDWTLRLAAEDDDVLTWHHAENRPRNELHKGKPTRALRVRYILRGRALDGDVAEIFVSSLLKIQRQIEGHKHKLGERAANSVKHLIPAIEATLTFILFCWSHESCVASPLPVHHGGSPCPLRSQQP